MKSCSNASRSTCSPSITAGALAVSPSTVIAISVFDANLKTAKKLNRASS